MKEYDVIVIGTGSAMEIVSAAIQQNPSLKIAVIDKDDPGGICLTRGCIPSKILLYPSELVKTIERARDFGLNIEIKKIDFVQIMERMRTFVSTEIATIKQNLLNTKNIDYFPTTAQFTAPYALTVGDTDITSNLIILCIGSRPDIPTIPGLHTTGYLTSDTILKLRSLPKSIVIIGGGYIAAEYGYFLATMGSQVTIIGRNPQFLPEEEPEISALAKSELQTYITIITNHEVRRADKTFIGKKTLIAVNRETQNEVELTGDEILVATGRASNTDLLHPEKSGINLDDRGFIVVNEYMETSQPNIWALGDADGKYLFKHVANYEAMIVYYNAFLKQMIKADYHAVPHAIFTHPEIASVGLTEKKAIEIYSEDNVLIGLHRYQDVAKGEAMNLKDYFVKVLVERDTMKILGAHIIGPEASILIQEVVNLMYTNDQNMGPLFKAMHIHPALNEVVQRAFSSLMIPAHYHHVLQEHFQLPT